MNRTAIGTILLVVLSVVLARPPQDGEQRQSRLVISEKQLSLFLLQNQSRFMLQRNNGATLFAMSESIAM